MSMGMSGNWTLCKERAGGMYLPKHSHLRLYGMHTGLKQRIALCMVDTRRFAKWTWKEGFSAERGPCPVKEHDYFRANFITKVAHWPTKDTKLANAPALDIIMNQSIFNGIGNYLRAEIFYRADVNPFRSFSSYTHEQIERVLALCASVPLETMELGGGAIKDWSGEESSKERFYNWLQCYLKQSSLIDNGKRRFWYNPKWESTEEYLHYIYANRPEVLKLEKEIEESKKLKNKTVKAQDFETAAKLRDREKELTETLTDTLYALQTIDKANKMTNLHV
jgi:endonuclease VIII-like 1